MKSQRVYHYLFSCFILFLPVMAWDTVFTKHLPEAFQPEIFWFDIPRLLSYGEHISRTLLFLLAFAMPLQINDSKQKRRLLVYLCGLFLYFISWLLLMLLPDSAWSRSVFGFLAPAYTPAIWLGGIASLGHSFYFSLPYSRWFFILPSILFLVCHNVHALLVYLRLQE